MNRFQPAFKEPIAEHVMMRTLSLDGDRQADLSVHGGPSKAVYVYPVEHYEFWKREFPDMDLPWGHVRREFYDHWLAGDGNKHWRQVS